MNVDCLIHWATLTRKFLDNPQMPPGQTLDQERLQSVFGELRQHDAAVSQQSKSGFTRMVLGLAAAVVRPTNDYLQKAQETVGTKHVIRWAKQHLGPSLQGLRQQTLGRLSAEQKPDKEAVPVRAGF